MKKQFYHSLIAEGNNVEYTYNLCYLNGKTLGTMRNLFKLKLQAVFWTEFLFRYMFYDIFKFS